MHKIVSGVANRSYGIHVARMAGMPSSVVARAECVLNALESHELDTPAPESAAAPVSVPEPAPKPQPAIADCKNGKPQLTLFD